VSIFILFAFLSLPRTAAAQKFDSQAPLPAGTTPAVPSATTITLSPLSYHACVRSSAIDMRKASDGQQPRCPRTHSRTEHSRAPSLARTRAAAPRRARRTIVPERACGPLGNGRAGAQAAVGATRRVGEGVDAASIAYEEGRHYTAGRTIQVERRYMKMAAQAFTSHTPARSSTNRPSLSTAADWFPAPTGNTHTPDAPDSLGSPPPFACAGLRYRQQQKTTLPARSPGHQRAQAPRCAGGSFKDGYATRESGCPRSMHDRV